MSRIRFLAFSTLFLLLTLFTINTEQKPINDVIRKIKTDDYPELSTWKTVDSITEAYLLYQAANFGRDLVHGSVSKKFPTPPRFALVIEFPYKGFDEGVKGNVKLNTQYLDDANKFVGIVRLLNDQEMKYECEGDKSFHTVYIGNITDNDMNREYRLECIFQCVPFDKERDELVHPCKSHVSHNTTNHNHKHNQTMAAMESGTCSCWLSSVLTSIVVAIMVILIGIMGFKLWQNKAAERNLRSFTANYNKKAGVTITTERPSDSGESQPSTISENITSSESGIDGDTIETVSEEPKQGEENKEDIQLLATKEVVEETKQEDEEDTQLMTTKQEDKEETHQVAPKEEDKEGEHQVAPKQEATQPVQQTSNGL